MNDFYKRTLTSLLYENEEKEKESQDKKEIGDPGGLAVTRVDLEKKLPALLNKINQKIAGRINRKDLEIKISKDTAEKFDLPDSIYKPLNKELGVISSPKDLETIYCQSEIDVAGMKVKLAPFNARGEQTVDSSPADLKLFEKSQVLVFNVVTKDKEGKTISVGAESQSGKKSSYI